MNQPVWVPIRVVLAIHDRLIAEHGGASGVRDLALLESAIARPQMRRACTLADLYALAAAYAAGIVRNHPFLDGNKRTAFVTAALFLEVNGAKLIASEATATQAMFALAAGEMSDEEFAAWLREACEASRGEIGR